MTRDDDFRVRPGRIRSKRAQRARPFIAQALAAAQKAGGRVSRRGRISSPRASTFGRGRSLSVRANRLLTSRSRGAVVKARVVRRSGRGAPLATHLNYLQREGVTHDGEKGLPFGPDGGDADARTFAERCRDDRHHFRFIVSPDDALEMCDLRSFIRDLMRQAEQDLGTKLDWVGVDHALRIGRLRKLESLGLADQIAPGQWVLSESVETTLRELGERGDVIKRIRRGLPEPPGNEYLRWSGSGAVLAGGGRLVEALPTIPIGLQPIAPAPHEKPPPRSSGRGEGDTPMRLAHPLSHRGASDDALPRGAALRHQAHQAARPACIRLVADCRWSSTRSADDTVC
jgi:uncharacterized protein DUF3363